MSLFSEDRSKKFLFFSINYNFIFPSLNMLHLYNVLRTSYGEDRGGGLYHVLHYPLKISIFLLSFLLINKFYFSLSYFYQSRDILCSLEINDTPGRGCQYFFFVRACCAAVQIPNAFKRIRQFSSSFSLSVGRYALEWFVFLPFSM